MDDLVEKLAALPFNEAHNHLMSLQLPLELRLSIAMQANALRTKRGKAQRRAKLTHAYHAEMWFRLLSPLKYELSNAKVSLKLKDLDTYPERHAAFTEYVTLMEKLLAGLQYLQIQEGAKASAASFEAHANGTADEADYARTPAELAKERELPNKGEHWTDWVNDKTRTRIELLFDAIPTRAKRPKPFERRIPPQQYAKDVEALQRRTLKEMALLEQELDMLKKVEYCTREQLDRMDALKEERKRMVFVLYHTAYKQDRAPVPITWHGMAHLYYDEDETEDGSPRERRELVVWHLRKQYAETQPQRTSKKSNRPKRYRK